ncbi:MAG: PepSY-associated TM helix domain-containing protein [Steroidobacteraceae bacterium]
MRKLHRWLMSVFAVLLLYVAATGVWLNLYDLTDPAQAFAREGGGAAAPAPENVMGFSVRTGTALAHEQLAPMLKVVVAAVHAAAPNESIASIELRIENGVPRGIVGVGTQGKKLNFNTETGELLDASPSIASTAVATPSAHGFIKSLHRGAYFGPPGAMLVFVTAWALLVLCLTGIIMYLQLWRNRRRVGRMGFFWS